MYEKIEQRDGKALLGGVMYERIEQRATIFRGIIFIIKGNNGY